MQVETSSAGELSRTRLARRGTLLSIAAQLFLQGGYGATTMERIALTAGVSKATLYKYFPDKERLFLDLVKEGLLAPDRRLLAELRKTLQQTTAHLHTALDVEALERTLLGLLRASVRRRNDAFFRLLVEISFANPALAQAVRHELGEDVAREASHLTALSPGAVDAPALQDIVFLVIHGYMLLGDVPLRQEQPGPERLARSLAAMIALMLPPPIPNE